MKGRLDDGQMRGTHLIMRCGRPIRDSCWVSDVLLETVGAECAEGDGRGAVDGTDLPEGLGAHYRGGGVFCDCAAVCDEGRLFVGAVGGHLQIAVMMLRLMIEQRVMMKLR